MAHIVHEHTHTLTTGSTGLFVTGLVKQYVGLLLEVFPEIQKEYQPLISHNDSNTIPGRQVTRTEKNTTLQKRFDFIYTRETVLES